MSLTINHNLIATNAAREPGNGFASLADSGFSAANGLGMREIIRAEIKPLDSAEAQTPAAAPEASAAQAAASAPEQQTGSILNTTDMGSHRGVLGRLQNSVQPLNSQAQSGNVRKMMRSAPQTIGDRLYDPMMDLSIELSPQLSRREPMLKSPRMIYGVADKAVEAILSLFNVNG